VVEHCVHGLVTIRLEDPPERIAAVIQRLLGPSTGTSSGSADITVRFVDRLPSTAGLRWLNRREVAYDEQHFYLADAAGARAQVDIAGIGEPIQIVCERDIATLPLLRPIVSLRLLRLGHVFLHSAAFSYKGVCVLVVGWKKGGKTETLLPFMSAGASHIADEWTILSPDGTVRGIAGDLQIWNWHLRQNPEMWERVPQVQRRRIRAMRAYQRAYTAAPFLHRRRTGVYGLLADLARDGSAPKLGQVGVPPALLFEGRVHAGPAHVDRILFASVGDGVTVSVNEVMPETVAARMAASLVYERNALVVAHEQFRFAFPDRSNDWLLAARAEETRLLEKAFAGRPTFELVHPYPVDLNEMFQAAEPHIRPATRS
jgi:hypothetical protein